MKKLYIDFDGVLMDTIVHSYKMLEDLNLDSNDTEVCMNFYKNLDWDMLLEKSNEINEGFKTLKELIDKKVYDVSILTHVNSIDESVAKVNLLKSKIDFIDIISVPKNIKKADIVDPRGAILVDDYIGNLEYWEEKGGIPIRFASRKIDNKYKTISDLKEIFDFSL